MRAIAIGIPFIRRRSGAAIDAQAQAHFDRVIADGGLVPSGLSGVNAFFTTVKTIYATSDITTAISVGLDAQVLGYKLGAGAGTTAGQAAQKLYSCSGASGDVVQTTAASQPLLLVHSGANYFQGVGVANNFVSTPNATANNITGNIEIIWNYTPQNISVVSDVAVKFNGTQYAYKVAQFGSQRLQFESIYGTSTSTNHGVSSGTSIWFKITRTSSNGHVSFFKSTDGISYTLISTDTTKSAGALATGGELELFKGDAQVAKYNRLTISNSIGGAPVVDFNPNQYNAATSQTQWTSSTGEVWTIATGTATTGYKGQIVTKTIVMGDGVDDTLISSTLTSKQFFSQHIALNPLNIPASGGGYYVDGGGANGLIFGNAESIKAFNGSELDFIGDLEYRLQYVQADFNNTTSNLYLNNSNNVSGATGTRTTTRIVLFSNGSGASFGNAIMSTIISGITIDTATQRTNVYNYVRSINNNAF
jgi:hypothetical protein